MSQAAAGAIDPLLHLAATGLIALVLARALLEKLGNLALFAGTVRNYHLLPERMAAPAALALTLAEIATLSALLWPASRPAGALAALALLALYAGAMTQALRAGRSDFECGCGGSGQTVSWWLVVRNAVLMLLAIAVRLPVADRDLVWLDLAVAPLAVAAGMVLLAAAEKAIDTAAQIRRLETESYL